MRAVLEWLFAGGALFAGVSAALTFSNAERENRIALRIEGCKRANDSLLDDQLNNALSPSQRQLHSEQQLRISMLCSKDVAG